MKSVNVVQNTCNCGHISYDKEALKSCPSCGNGATAKWPREYHNGTVSPRINLGRCPACYKMLYQCSCNTASYNKDEPITM